MSRPNAKSGSERPFSTTSLRRAAASGRDLSNELKTPLKPAKPLPEMARKEPITVSLEPRKAFTVERAPGGWCFVTVSYTDDGQVESIVKSQPDIKPIILEAFKIAALKWWTSIG